MTADRPFYDTPCSANRIDPKPHVFNVVQRVEDAEDIKSRVDRLLAEVMHHVVGVARVAYRVGASLGGASGGGRWGRLPGVWRELARRALSDYMVRALGETCEKIQSNT